MNKATLLSNIARIFRFDTLICSINGEVLQVFMMKKHAWSEEMFKKYLATYQTTLFKEGEYIVSEKIVNEHKKKKQREIEASISACTDEVLEYFKNNKVCGCKIKEVRFEKNHDFYGDKKEWNASISIIPIKPYFDEDYSDDKADEDIEAIGQKYKIHIGWESGVYGK